ncbi:MAG: D-2-hydroxyacid dehydrogenase [Solobacterium sp.]|nr:D-2-hydroxyacid dehydrogenase [Solobacterium sp.]
MKKVVCVMEEEYELNDQQKEQIRYLCSLYDYSTVFCVKEDAFSQVEDAEIIYGYDAKLLEYAKELKWFASTWAGVNSYLKSEYLREDTILTNAGGCFGVTISEHMIAVLIMMMRRIPEYEKIVENGEWRNDFLIDTIYGKTALVLGTGDIGTRFAERLKAFKPVRIIGVNRSGEKKSDIYDEVYPVTELDTYLPEADIVAMSLPETLETQNVLSAERIALMKEGAYLVNVGRGTSIDEDALAQALNEHKLKGAALDVFRVEPLPLDAPIRNAENVLITPHCAGQMGAEVTRDLHVKMFLENLKRYFNGNDLLNVIDRERGY